MIFSLPGFNVVLAHFPFLYLLSFEHLFMILGNIIGDADDYVRLKISTVLDMTTTNGLCYKMISGISVWKENFRLAQSNLLFGEILFLVVDAINSLLIILS